jgi:hypothetical protein
MTRSAFKTALEESLQMPHGWLKESDSRETVTSWSSIADVQILMRAPSFCRPNKKSPVGGICG